MAGIRIKLPSPFVGPDIATLPTLYDVDKIESAGSLALVDMTHPAGPIVGVPADLADIPNLLGAKAAAAIGVAAATLNFTAYNTGHLIGAQGRLERSIKGGLAAVISPTYFAGLTTPTNGAGIQFRLPANIRAYIRANPTHSYYASNWARATRLNGSANRPVPGAQEQTAASFAISATSITPAGGVLVGQRGQIPSATATPDAAPVLRNGCVTTLPVAYYGVAATVDPARGYMVGLGAYNVYMAGTDRGKSGSWIFYRSYIEDLTVSGRSYAQLDALDLALFTAECLTVGGRYYGDTVPTDPTTIP